MKRSILYIGSFLVSMAGLQSCLDYTEVGSEFNLDQSKVDQEVFQGQVDNIDYHKEISEEGFKEAEQALETYFKQSGTAQFIMLGGKEGQPPAAHSYQRVYSLGPDCYAGYSTVSHKDFMYGTLTSTYNISDDFNTGPHFLYSGSKNYLMSLLNHPKIDSIPEMKAINLLFYCLAAQEMADLSGPFTYLEDKANVEEPTVYNDLKTIYYGIEDNLDTIVACLKHFENRPDWYKERIKNLMEQQWLHARIETGYQGVTPYIKMANSLKLRMAMHLVKVEPATAEKWYKEAVESGVMDNASEQIGIFYSNEGNAHPLIDISVSWGDYTLSASFESLLISLNHPYKDYLFTKNLNPIVNAKTGETLPANTRLCGIRGGTLVGDGQTYPTNPLAAYSRVNKEYFQEMPLYYFKYAEVCFLRAEGALRGWDTDGDPEYFYNLGIRNADCDDPTYWNTMPSPYQEQLDAYLNQENPVDYVNVDPVGGGEDWPSVTKIGVKWNNADSQETKLEKIITQKYIALYPNSLEAWGELRRTGYPKLFPILNTDDGDGSIEQGDMIRRIPWAATDPRVQENIQATGLDALGGDDFQATRLWWDVDAPNF